MDAVAFSAGQHRDFLLLVSAGEIEARNIRPRIHFTIAELDQIKSVGDFFPNGFVRIKRTILIYERELRRFANSERAAVGLLLS